MNCERKDLGTYHLRVEFVDGDGYIEKWRTGGRFTEGTDDVVRIGTIYIKPPYEDEQDVIESMLYSSLEGNMSCDCNKKLLLARAYQREEPEDPPCGDTMTIKRLTIMRPDGTEKAIYEL